MHSEPADHLQLDVPAEDGPSREPAHVEPLHLDAESLLVRAFVHEVQTGALITAGATSAVNATDKPICGPIYGIALGEARRITLDFPARLDNWPRRILDEEIPADTIELVVVFYAAFQGARSRLVALEREAEEIGLGRALSLHVRPLVTAWRLASQQAELATAALTEDCSHVLPQTYVANTTLLKQVLQRASSGGRPCLDTDGSISLPRLPERRRAPRRSMLQTATVSAGNARFTAFVRDVSVGGLRLSRMSTLPVGQDLVVELESGRLLTGSIVWSKGDQAGVRFDRELLPTDPLVFG